MLIGLFGRKLRRDESINLPCAGSSRTMGESLLHGHSSSNKWQKGLCECCGGGAGVACYVCLCPFCAAGDSARSVDRAAIWDCIICPILWYETVLLKSMYLTHSMQSGTSGMALPDC